MKFLTALMTTFALSIAQPVMAQVYTQQEINYLTTMEQGLDGVMPSDEIQKTLPFAHSVCAALREGVTEEQIIRYTVVKLAEFVQDGRLSASDARFSAFIYGAAIEGAQQEICPDVR